MERYRIKIIDNIAPEGLAIFNNRYSADRDENDPHGIFLGPAVQQCVEMTVVLVQPY